MSHCFVMKTLSLSLKCSWYFILYSWAKQRLSDTDFKILTVSCVNLLTWARWVSVRTRLSTPFRHSAPRTWTTWLKRFSCCIGLEFGLVVFLKGGRPNFFVKAALSLVRGKDAPGLSFKSSVNSRPKFTKSGSPSGARGRLEVVDVEETNMRLMKLVSK